jgi:hypothetical protein
MSTEICEDKVTLLKTYQFSNECAFTRVLAYRERITGPNEADWYCTLAEGNRDYCTTLSVTELLTIRCFKVQLSAIRFRTQAPSYITCNTTFGCRLIYDSPPQKKYIFKLFIFFNQ